ncbi:septum formation protein Maf [bacterium]|nr:septum formation protein Maf [bacterium]
MPQSPLILASRSPRRSALLRQIGLEFTCLPSSVDEILDETVSPADHVTILSERKARDVASTLDEGVVVGADTIVVLDGEIIEKPASPDEAVQMLQRLSNARHEVFTGYALVDAATQRTLTRFERTEVWFRQLAEEEISSYVQSGSPMDKAGAYGIQDDFGAVFVRKIVGDYYNVVGLPLCSFYCSYRTFTKQGPEINGCTLA